MPEDIYLQAQSIAIDTEAMGLNNFRDRLCVIQLSDGLGQAHVVHFPQANYACPNLRKLLSNPNIIKIFHFARFDVAIIQHYLKIEINNIYCTKIASKLCRTYTDQHSLKDLCNEVLGIKISKQCRTSDWGASILTQDQIDYAASDVLYLHKIKQRLDEMLTREGRTALANSCFQFIPARVKLDLSGWLEADIFSHI